jgi:hypothetical protein
MSRHTLASGHDADPAEVSHDPAGGDPAGGTAEPTEGDATATGTAGGVAVGVDSPAGAEHDGTGGGIAAGIIDSLLSGPCHDYHSDVAG